ncbi:hypothetical protein L521_2261 [Bordetella bronchiseptica MBORD698]|nr:hypothetical protein L521_2261 [Bordetella bronchiseptica MBORD698]
MEAAMGWLTDNFGAPATATSEVEAAPAYHIYRAHAVQARQVDELIGLVKGVLADGAICQEEVAFLLRWMQTNQDASNKWPAKALYPRIAAALADGHMDAMEEAEIMALLLATVGSEDAAGQPAINKSTALPLCSPVPDIHFDAHTFCFTGKFTSGTRDWCSQQVVERGGSSLSNVTKKLDYLVIGELGNPDWLHSTFGLKIKKAVDYRSSGVALRIISEQAWYEHLLS